jgi:4-hydroxy-tetrahydrodipicolinate synthase
MIERSPSRLHALFQGVEGMMLPSFSDGYHDLDEAGVRLDVRAGIAQGYFSLFCAPPAMTRAEYARMLAIVADESGNRIATSAVVDEDTAAANLEVLAAAERAGCTHALLNVRYIPGSAPQLSTLYRRLIESTSLGIVLYAYPSAAVRAFDSTGVPLDVFDELADLPNVVAMKLTQTMDLELARTCCRRLSDRLVIGSADLAILPQLASLMPIRWTGQWLTDAVQTPEHPYVCEYIDLLAAGRIDDALALYTQFAPAYEAFAALQRPYLLRADHPWNHMKYYQWCAGGNGGLLRPGNGIEPEPDEAARTTIRTAFANAGIAVRAESDATFARGRAQSEGMTA